MAWRFFARLRAAKNGQILLVCIAAQNVHMFAIFCKIYTISVKRVCFVNMRSPHKNDNLFGILFFIKSLPTVRFGPSPTPPSPIPRGNPSLVPCFGW